MHTHTNKYLPAYTYTYTHTHTHTHTHAHAQQTHTRTHIRTQTYIIDRPKRTRTYTHIYIYIYIYVYISICIYIYIYNVMSYANNYKILRKTSIISPYMVKRTSVFRLDEFSGVDHQQDTTLVFSTLWTKHLRDVWNRWRRRRVIDRWCRSPADGWWAPVKVSETIRLILSFRTSFTDSFVHQFPNLL